MKKTTPPQWVDSLLAWFCEPSLLLEIQGDLHELFQRWGKDFGWRKARWLYLLHVLTFFRPYFIAKIKFSYPVTQSAMIKNYFIIAIRSLRKQKLYAFINIGGLAVGLACFILILLFVQYELSYDRFYENADHTYRMVKRYPGYTFHGMDSYAVTPGQLAATLVEEYPEVKAATTITDQSALLSLNDEHFWEKGLWADPHFFEVFTFPLLQGNPKTALAQPNSIVLTESLSRKIFKDKNPIGETLLFGKNDLYKVTGIMPDVPDNSSLKFSFVTAILSQDDYQGNLAKNTWNSNFYTFFVLADGADAAQLQAKMPAFLEKYLTAADGENPSSRLQYLIQPLTDMHLRSHFNFDIAFTGDIKYVYLFSAIAFVILLLACINYTNLAIARSIKRAREVGMRKVIGAKRGQLITQFLGESLLMTLLALALALVLVQSLLPFFGHLMERPIQLDYLKNGLLLPGLLMLVVLVGLFSGSYPAFFMASLKPILVLKGKLDGRPDKFRLQGLLMVGQYTVSIALVAVSLIIYNQLQYIQHKNLGYDRDHIVTIRVNDGALQQNYQVIKNEWLGNPFIMAVSASGSLPTYIESNNGITGWEGSSPNDHLDSYIAYADYDFLDVFGIQLAAGRNFSQNFATDSLSAALINETAARTFGWTAEEAIGKHFVHNHQELTIVGVMKDFHMHSMHMAIEPLVIRPSSKWISYISVKVRPEHLTETIAALEKTVKQFSSYPFEYQFLDEQFDQLYKQEIRLGEIFGFFTLLALVIASLGLFGLAAFTAEQRTKEIGIRKVLGASVRGIVSLLAQNFLRMVILSFLLATPIAWYAAHRWLQDFAYRIDLQWWVFALAGGLALVIAWCTISYQSIRAARTNPVDSLRNE